LTGPFLIAIIHANSVITVLIRMKYLQACQVKAIVDKAIASLEKNAQEGKVTVAGKKQLMAAYVSGPRIVFIMVPLTL